MTIIFLAILGAAVGSFLNVCIDRLPRRQSLLRPPSRCDSCRVPLGRMELVPIISFLALRGRCRSCHISIPRRSPLVETIMAAAFVLLVYYFGLGTQSAILAFYIAIFTVIFFHRPGARHHSEPGDLPGGGRCNCCSHSSFRM
jgi:leader peptidase (prepilin peptidase)/N-methyltransferase